MHLLLNINIYGLNRYYVNKMSIKLQKYNFFTLFQQKMFTKRKVLYKIVNIRNKTK